MSIDRNIFDVHCPYQAMSSMSIVRIIVDINHFQHQRWSFNAVNKHNSAATNVSDVEQDEYCNKASWVLFLSSNQEELVLFYFPKFNKGLPPIWVESR